jgi:hypothetical protein
LLDKDIAAVFAAEIDNCALMLQADSLLPRHKGMTDGVLDKDIIDSGVSICRCLPLFSIPPSLQATDQ